MTNERLPESPPRIDLAELAPDFYKAMIRLDTVARQGVDPTLIELVTSRNVPGHYTPAAH